MPAFCDEDGIDKGYDSSHDDQSKPLSLYICPVCYQEQI